MKKFTLFTFLFLLSMTYGFAQILNPSFENWTTYTALSGSVSGSYPTSWVSSDSVYEALSGGTAGHSAVQEIVDKCDGNYSVKLTTVAALGQVAPGVVCNGTIAGLGIVSGGQADNVRHLTFKGCYKYTSGGAANVAIITAVLFKHNSTTGGRDTVAAVLKSITTTTSGMVSFADNFAYHSTQIPDTMLIVVASSPGLNSPAAVAGSILVIDSLGVNGIASNVQDLAPLTNVKVYPSPVTGDALHLDVTFGHYVKATYSVIDGLGRMVKTGALKETQQLNIADLANGMYTLTLNNESGEQLYSTRVTVRR